LSKNFELLQQAEKDQEVYRPAQPVHRPAGTVAPADEAPHRLKLEARTLEEAMRLAQRLFVLPGEDAPRAVLFTGVNHGNGCSTVCACAADALQTQVNGTICVVDANLHGPSLAGVYGLDSRRGLVEALTQAGPARSFTQQMGGSRLFILTAGTLGRDSYNLLSSDALRARMAELRAEFDYVLVDSPPVNLYADALTLSHTVDGVVLVLQAEVTHRESARKASESIQAAGSRVLGAVLNQRTYPIPQKLYDRL
jgi:capsular exopolysaccharide synthesis family protein